MKESLRKKWSKAIEETYIRIGFLEKMESGVIKITDKQVNKILHDTTRGLESKE